MIEVCGAAKSFDSVRAVDSVDVTIREHMLFGLIGTNGAGKSTLLRIITGILKPDKGAVAVDGMPVYDNVAAKKLMFFISDEPYFFANGTPSSMERYYSSLYENYNKEEFYQYLESFGIDKNRKANALSKGMKKQLALLLGICAHTKYILCDETFDGLDPVMRQAVKSIFAKEMEENGLTPIIASHNLRELEDICDHVGLLHKGGILMSKDLEDMKCNIHKVQCVFASDEDERRAQASLNILKDERRGSLHTITIRGSKEEIIAVFATVNTVFCEILPLSLEEIFISETEVAGYDIKKLIAG